MTTEEKIWNYFIEKGFSTYGTAGIMGNMYKESSLQPNNLQNTGNTKLKLSDAEYTKQVDDGTYKNFINDGYGYGLVQWTYYSLKADLYNLCKVRKVSISDLQAQLDIVYYHLQTHKILESLQKAKSVREASDIFLTKFERPKDQSENVKKERAKCGEVYFNKYAKKEGGSTMKYSSSNAPLVCMQTNSTCYKGTKKMAVKGVLWHSTGANNTTIKRYVQPSDNDPNKAALLAKIGTNPNKNDWNHSYVEAGLNAWIGTLADGSVTTVQTMPWDYAPWGCGAGAKGSCNNGWIQFEICEDNLNNSGYFQKVYEEACQLTAYLCKLYNIDPKGTVSFNGVKVPTILCHQDSYKLGLGSNHGDVYHWFNKYGRTMDTVRTDVARIMSGSGTTTTTTPTQPTTTTTTQTTTRPTLKKGASGSDVEYLQQSLIKLGYSCGSWGADGDFGNDTLKAVKKFQSDHNIAADGVVGASTWQALTEALTASTPAVDEIYRVRKSWDQPGTQIGAYKDLNNAKRAVDALNNGYHVYNSKGQEIYPTASAATTESQTVTTQVATPATLPVATKYNDVKIGHACHDERGKYTGGKAGDQDGTEVQISNWYNQNWDTVLRPKTQALAEKIARACEGGCNNNKIGYSQSARNTIYIEALKVGLDLSKITTACNCDCSSFVSVCCIAAGLSAAIFYAGGNMRTTWTMTDACKKTNQFYVYNTNKYTRQKNYLRRGDIILNTNQHVAIVLQDGANAEPLPAVTTTTTSVKTTNYLVKINVEKLNIKSAPNANSNTVGVVTKGQVYTIVEEEGGYGRLKSGAGWLNLSHTVKI